MVAAEIDKTQETFFSELPVEWRYDRLKDIVSLRNDKTSDKSSKQNYLELEDIEQGTGNLLSKKNTLDVESAIIRFKKGDVLFGKLRPYLEKYYYADFDGKCTGEILAFYPRGIQGHFLRYCVAAPWFIGKCNALAYGAKMPRVNWPKQLALFEIPIPSNSEQHRIAAYLDKTCTSIDKTIEFKQKQLEILDALRKSIVHKAVTRGLDDSVELKDSGVEWLGRIPKHWDCQHLKRGCSRIQTGSTPPTANTEYYVDGTIPWYAPGCYDGGIYLQEPAKKINEIAYFNNKLRLYPAHSIFIVGIGATIGKVAMTRVEASCNQQITALVCKSDVYAKYLTYHLKIFESIIPRIAQFTTLPIIDQNKIGYLQIALPPIKEQEQIAEFLDDKIAKNDRLENSLVKQISTLEQYRKSLIHECVTGKKRITDGDV